MASAVSSLDSRWQRARRYVRSLWDRREFAWFLAMGTLRARNASTALGLFWWVLNPLLLGMVYFLVFGFLFGSRDIAYLLSGMFAFHFTSQSVIGGAQSILRNSKLLINLSFPRLILPLAQLMEASVGFLSSLVVFFLITGPMGRIEWGGNLAFLPLLLLVHTVFNLGVGLIAARLAVPFRDVTNFIPYLNRIWLYLTPIIWPLARLDSFSPLMQEFVRANPMYSFVGLYRTVLLGYEFSPSLLIQAVAWALILVSLGLVTFVRSERKIVRYL